MKASMKEHFENWMKEKLMENWKREMSMIPTIFNNAEDLKKGGGLKNYLADLKKMEENANLKCTGSIDEIVEMVQYNNAHAKLKLDESKIVNEESIKIIQKQRETCKLETNVDAWTEDSCKFQGPDQYPKLFNNIN